MRRQHHGRTEMHAHEFFELVLIAEGASLHSFEGQTQVMTAGDLFIIHPGERHSYIDTKRTTLYNCLFLPDLLLDHVGRFRHIPKLRFLYEKGRGKELHKVHVDVSHRQRFINLLDQMIREAEALKTGWQTEIESLFLSLMVNYARLAEDQQAVLEENGANYRQVMRAIAYIEDNYREQPSVTEIAAASGMSPSYLSRLFRAYLGSSPSEYSRSYRINKAAELILKTDLTLGDIATKLGYPNLAIFSRQFRQLTGEAPSVFRRRERAAYQNDPHFDAGSPLNTQD